MANKDFAARFSKALSMSGISQKELAERLGVHPSNITNYKKGAYVPNDLNTISKIASILGVSPAWLAGMVDDEAIPAPTEIEVLRNKVTSMLPSYSKEQLTKLVRFMEEFL